MRNGLSLRGRDGAGPEIGRAPAEPDDQSEFLLEKLVLDCLADPDEDEEDIAEELEEDIAKENGDSTILPIREDDVPAAVEMPTTVPARSKIQAPQGVRLVVM